MYDESPEAGRVPTVTYLGRAMPIPQGGVLTFGRGSTCDVVLPNDSHLSRLAGSMTTLEDCVLIRNHSTTKQFVLRPPAGEDRVVEPGAAGTSLPHQRLHVVLTGLAGVSVVLSLDTGTSGSPPLIPPGAAPPHQIRTETAPFPLSGAQRRVLEALCAPMMSGHGPRAAPATYNEIGAALGLSPAYARKVIQSIRETLHGYGVPHLVSDDPTRPDGDFRWSLARYAIRNRLVGEPTEDRRDVP